MAAGEGCRGLGIRLPVACTSPVSGWVFCFECEWQLSTDTNTVEKILFSYSFFTLQFFQKQAQSEF